MDTCKEMNKKQERREREKERKKRKHRKVEVRGWGEGGLLGVERKSLS